MDRENFLLTEKEVLPQQAEELEVERQHPTLSSQAQGDGCGELLSTMSCEGLWCWSPAQQMLVGEESGAAVWEATDRSPECTELPILHLGAAVGDYAKG